MQGTAATPAAALSERAAERDGNITGPHVTSGLNLTEIHRFEFAVAAAAGAVD
jgi:hypothetical protein